MKRVKFYFLLTAVLIFTGRSVNAQLNNIYSATQSPVDAGWTELKLDATLSDSAANVSQTVANGVLKLQSITGGKFSQLGWYKTGLGLDLSKGYTIEIKAKILDASKYGAFNIQGYDNEGKGFRLGIYNSYLAESTNPLAATNVIKDGLNNADGFHIYRLAVAPSGIVTVYRDQVKMGEFPLSAFYFDNIIENGGFEDGGTDVNNRSFFPDFLSEGELYRTDASKDVSSGKYSLAMYNNYLVQNPDMDEHELARTRDIAVKPGTKYDISIARRRIDHSGDAWAWRDMGAFWDFQEGCLGEVDHREQNVMFAAAWENKWLVHNQTVTTPADDGESILANSIRFEFPSWVRNGDKYEITTAFDNFVFREKMDLQVGPTVSTAHVVPTIPEGVVNLIENGDFEDWETNNDGTAYEWALSNIDDGGANFPAEHNDLWNGPVRLQRHDQSNDGLSDETWENKWAHSGTTSLRFSTLNEGINADNGLQTNFDFAKELEPNKTYCFNFWHKSPKWDGDWGWLKVRVGDDVIYGQELKGRNNVWANTNLVFTTTEENKTLHLYTETGAHGDWWNIYLDDLVLYEVTGDIDPQIAGKTNLFPNGDFETVDKDIDGSTYEWALASEFPDSGDNMDNYPVAWSDKWGTYVRLQDKQKFTDTGYQWAHSGNNSLRFSYLDDWGKAWAFEGLTDPDEMPDTYRLNMNFKHELQPNKTYTFVFWFRTANYGDRGTIAIANGDIRLWQQELSTRYVDWTRQSITFSTTGANHTLRIFSEFGGWFNFYLDDLFLYEESDYVPYVSDGDSYLFFGKSTGTENTDVEIEYIAVDVTPTGIVTPKTENVKNLYAYSKDGLLTVNTLSPAPVQIYDVAGALVAQLNIKSASSVSLPKGVYIVKSGTEVVKVVNK
jgi:hypothetical protein